MKPVLKCILSILALVLILVFDYWWLKTLGDILGITSIFVKWLVASFIDIIVLVLLVILILLINKKQKNERQ